MPLSKLAFFIKICQLKQDGTISENVNHNYFNFYIKIKYALNIKPLSDRVLIEPVAAETKLLQGFYS
jgi:hypothetical protein